MDKFMIALNPLIKALNDDDLILKYVSRSHRQYLSLAIADDLTLVTLFTIILGGPFCFFFSLSSFSEGYNRLTNNSHH